MKKQLLFVFFLCVKIGFSQSNIPNHSRNDLNINIGTTQTASISVVTPITGGGTRTDTRTFSFRLPSANPACNLPVLMAFHGDGGSGAGMEASTGFSTLADAQNFIAVYPDKLSSQSYFSYRIDAPAYLNGQIDETFMLAIIEYLYKNYGINKNRVYATGHSSGAAFVYFLTAKLPNSFAAFAPVAGYPQDYSVSGNVWTNAIASLTTLKLPILHIHGTADAVGGTEYIYTNLPNPYPATPTNNSTNPYIWPMFPLSNKSCTNGSGNYTSSYFQAGNTYVDKLVFCAGGGLNKEVSMLIVRGMGHAWPNSANTNGVDGSLAIWNFVKDYQLNTFSSITPTISPSSITITSGASTTLTASGCGSFNYLWSNGQTSTSINVSPATTTNYTVSCQSVVSNCQVGIVSNTATVTVTSGNPISVSANPTTVCEGSYSQLTVTGCVGGVSWNTGQTSTSFYAYPTTSTTYTATCSAGGSGSATVTVNLSPAPTITSTVPTTISDCGNTEVVYLHTAQTTTLTASGCTGTITWDDSNTTSTGNSLVVTAPSLSTENGMKYLNINCLHSNGCSSFSLMSILNQFATDDNFTTAVNTPVSGNVITNDTETSVAWGAYGPTTTPHGTITWVMGTPRPTGAFTYTPNTDFQGTDTFTYFDSDDLTCTKRATVTITVGNPCVTNIDITTATYPNYTANQVVQAAEYIGTISPPNIVISTSNSNNLTYQAGKAVMLNPGFSTQNGTVFSAKIGDCNGANALPYLKVVGTNIKNKCGTNLLIRGVNFTGYFQYDINNPAECLDRINQIKLTGTNTVRLPWLSSTQYGRDYTVLDVLMQRIIDQKMIIMIDFHDLTCQALTPANIQIATNYWLSPNILAILKKYENYLLLNIANEVGNDWEGNSATVRQKLIDAYTPAITALRNAGLKCPFVIDAPDCGQTVEALVGAAPTLLANDPDHNIVFSAHAYWNNDNYTTRLSSAATNAANAGICLIIGEFSVAQDCPPNAQSNDYAAIMQVCNQFNLGYLSWEWGGSRQYGNDGNVCPDDSRGVGYSRLTMSGSSGLNVDVLGWGIPVRSDIQATSIESCQFN